MFVPDTVNISVGDTVRWTWAESGHSVTSGDPCTADGQFCSPNNTNCGQCVTSSQGFVYEFTFTQAGSFSYFCCVHCAIGMTGVVNVSGGACSWAAGPDMPRRGGPARLVSFSRLTGSFTSWAAATSIMIEFTNPFEYDPVSNSWTTKSATYPDALRTTWLAVYLTTAERTISIAWAVPISPPRPRPVVSSVMIRLLTASPTVASNWPPGDVSILPGGFTVFNNTFYILGGFDILMGPDRPDLGVYA